MKTGKIIFELYLSFAWWDIEPKVYLASVYGEWKDSNLPDSK